MGRNYFLLRAITIIVGLLMVAICGCQKPKVEIVAVSGIVTLDGEPLRDATISFLSPSGYVASAPIDGEGRFQLSSQYGPGIPRASYQVTILPKRQSDPTDPATMTGRKLAAASSAIPTKFQYPHSSGLTATVNGVAEKLQFALSTKPH